MSKQTSINRRGFLKGTTGAGLLICSSRVAFGYQANEKLNVACIGVGGQGVSNVRGVSGENVVAVCDLDEERAAKMLKEYSAVKRYTDFRFLLDEMNKEIDAVVVCTPDHTHAVAAVRAMKLGKHVYCEKPLTRTVHEARMMRLTAAKQNVVTQMGNQGSASEGVRRATEWGAAGTAGPISEAYLWVGDGSAPMTLPTDTPPVPKGLDWDLWLGPASERPYHPGYLPFKWRSWRHFGSGSLGDMGCHTGNFLFRCLDLGQLWEPAAAGEAEGANRIKIEGEATGVHAEGYPASTRVHFHVPARGDLPPVKLTVSSGVEMRPAPELLHGKQAEAFGSLLIGSKASIYSSNPWNTSSELLTKNEAKIEEPPKTLPRGVGHHQEWIEACKGKGETFSSFAIGGPLTELIQLANVAGIVGEPFHYDPLTGEIPDHAGASALLHRPYRKGWTL
ncbi:MAG: putative dehydrogenase [Verrucomicrobiales bacterium]|jgi:predicted dehydrogenase